MAEDRIVELEMKIGEMWSLLGLAGMGAADWTPRFNYWRRPERLDDGGENLLG